MLIGPVEAMIRLTQVSAEVPIQSSTSATPCADPGRSRNLIHSLFPTIGGPQYNYIEEMAGDWGEFGQEGPDGVPVYNTIQTSPPGGSISNMRGCRRPMPGSLMLTSRPLGRHRLHGDDAKDRRSAH